MKEGTITLTKQDIAEALEEILSNLPPMDVQQQMVEMVKRLTDMGVPESEATILVFDKLEGVH